MINENGNNGKAYEVKSNEMSWKVSKITNVYVQHSRMDFVELNKQNK